MVVWLTALAFAIVAHFQWNIMRNIVLLVGSCFSMVMQFAQQSHVLKTQLVNGMPLASVGDQW